MKKAWDPSAVPAPVTPSYDGVVLSHNESDELMEDGCRAVTSDQADELRTKLSEEDARQIVQRDLGFDRIIWTCPLSLLKKAARMDQDIQQHQAKVVPLRAAGIGPR